MGTRSTTGGDVSLKYNVTIVNTQDNAKQATSNQSFIVVSDKISNGVSNLEATRSHVVLGTISSGGTTDIDLFDFTGIDVGAGAGLDALGQALAIEEITTFILECIGATSQNVDRTAFPDTAAAGTLELQPAAPAGDWTVAPTLTAALGNGLRAGATFMLHSPDEAAFDVNDSVSHVIRLGANGADVTFRLTIMGRHDDDESSSSSSSSSSTSTSTSTSTSQSSTPTSSTT